MACVAIELITKETILNSKIELFMLDAENNSLNCTLPSINNDGCSYLFKRIDYNESSSVILTALLDDTINNNQSYQVNVGQSFRIVSYNHNYIII